MNKVSMILLGLVTIILALTNMSQNIEIASIETALQEQQRVYTEIVNTLDFLIQTSQFSKKYEERDCIVTAYCPCKKCCGGNADGITASGRRINKGDKFVASSTGYPFGTKVYIPGYSNEPVEILDRGKDLADNHFDVYFDRHQTALEWGKRTIKVLIYKNSSMKDK